MTRAVCTRNLSRKAGPDDSEKGGRQKVDALISWDAAAVNSPAFKIALSPAAGV